MAFSSLALALALTVDFGSGGGVLGCVLLSVLYLTCYNYYINLVICSEYSMATVPPAST